MNDDGKHWEKGKEARVVQWIKQEIGLHPPTPEQPGGMDPWGLNT